MIWNRWTRWTARVLVGLLAIPAFGGCKQQLFLEPGDYQDAVKYGVPAALQANPHEAIVPPVVDPKVVVATVIDPNRPPRFLALKEAIAVALEQGNDGGGVAQFQNGGVPVYKSEQLPQFNGGQSFNASTSTTDAVRAFALTPGEVVASIERSLSKFDARWVTSMQWQKVDQPVAAQFLSFQQQRDAANFSTSLLKPLPTGGVAGITFSVDYSKFGSTGANNNQFVNPNYTPRLQFSFDQPLLQLFGVEVNQLTSTAPTSLTQNIRPSGGQGVEGILITRIRFDQSRAEFERRVNFLLVNVESAYWNLYASYYALYAQEEGLRQSFDGYRFTEARVQAGTDPPQALDQSRAQFELFRANVIRARGIVLESERQLRGLLGLRSDDGVRLVPVDEPNLAPFRPDFYEAANDAMTYRPELLMARQEVKAQQLNVVLQKNLRRPDLRVFGLYDVAGLGTRLDGQEFTNAAQTVPGNAFVSFGNNQFNSWTIGLRMDMPLGFRDANAQVRQANLQMTRYYYYLRDAELKALEFLTGRYRRLVETHAVIPPLTERRRRLQVYVEKTREVIRIGKFTPQDYFNLLQVQRDLADAINQEFRAIADYNSALAEFEFAKGTILRYNNVSLAEGPLPPWVAKRAADHVRERTEAAIKLRERPGVAAAGAVGNHPVGPATGNPFHGSVPPITDMPAPGPQDVSAPIPNDPKNYPLSNPRPTPEANPGAGPVPNPLPMNVGTSPAVVSPRPTVPQPEPVFVPSPTSGQPTGQPGSGEYFKQEGTVTIPPSKPLRPQGFTPMPGGVPVPNPDLPPVPMGPTGGIPATLPPSGAPTITTVPGGPGG